MNKDSGIKKILIVEDEFTFAKIIKMRLEASGYAVTIAGDAYSGTQQILKNDYDLMILDLNMPAGGGFAILERIQKFPLKTVVPVIITTGRHLNEALLEQAESYGVSAVMQKPFEHEDLVSKVKSLIQ